MIVGLGTDIVEIDRIEQVLQRYGADFLNRVYTPEEQREGNGRISYLAGRWAAKESAAKALGCGIGTDCSFTDIEVLNDELGRPVMACRAAAVEKIGGDLHWHVSISHEGAYAVATAIVEKP